MDSVVQFFSQLGALFNSLSPSKRVSIIAVALIVILSITAFVFFVNQKQYGALFSNLSAEDAGGIVARLQEKKIPYKVSGAGGTILVPEESVSELRLEMAVSGLPSGGGIGFEIFDNKNFGATDFVQQMNYQRALQGELARTINGLDEVQQTRVHIVIPRQSLFVEEQVKPTASVIIKPRSGKRLRASQVEGIVALVSSSVEGLLPEAVMVVDSSGNILSSKRSADSSSFSKSATSQIDYQRNIEKDLANRIQSMLEKVVGDGRVVAKVSAAIDFSVVEKTEEAYDPEEPVVRSMRRNSKKSGVSSEGGESSVRPTGEETASRGMGREETNEVVNYEINRVVSKTVMPVGEVEKLSVAVMVDGVYKKNDKGTEEFQPRSADEMKSLEGLVKKAVGFDAGRGDQVAVTSIPFRKLEMDMPEEGGALLAGLPAALPFVKYIISLMAMMLVLFFILRPLIKFILATGGERGSVSRSLPATVTERAHLEGGSASLPMGGGLAELATGGLKEVDVVRKLAGQDARAVAEALKGWLR